MAVAVAEPEQFSPVYVSAWITMKEMRPGMRIFPRAILVIIVLTITLTGCVQQTANVANNIPANAATPAPKASPQIVKASASDADAMPVTLPVQDAIVAEERLSAEM